MESEVNDVVETKMETEDVKQESKERVLEDYTFLIPFHRLRGNSKFKSDKCKLFIASRNKKEYMIKRIFGSKEYFPNEHELPSRVNDEKIINFVDVFHDKDYHYLISEYKKGVKDLFTYIKYIDVDEKLTIEIIVEILKCIKLCHDNNIIHLDMKMENLLLLSKEPIKLQVIDFGFAVDASTKKLDYILGTDIYIPPEIESEYTCSKACDIYSIGMIAVSLLISSNSSNTKKLVTKFMKKCKNKEFKELISDMISQEPESRPTVDVCLERMEKIKT